MSEGATLIRIFIAAAVYFCGLFSVLKGVSTNLTMMDELNAALPEDKRYDPVLATISQRLKYKSQYRAMFPKSRQLKRTFVFQGIGIILMFTAFGIAVFPYLFGKK